MINFEENQKEIIAQTVEKYGDKQLMQAVEEMAELMQALSKYQRIDYTGCQSLIDCWNRQDPVVENITEEMADVYIMLEQLQIFFEIDDKEIKSEIDRKLTRQKERNAKND